MFATGDSEAACKEMTQVPGCHSQNGSSSWERKDLFMMTFILYLFIYLFIYLFLIPNCGELSIEVNIVTGSNLYDCDFLCVF